MTDALINYLPVFLLAAGLSFGMTLVVRALARRVGVVDHPDGFRKVQERPVPRLGGLAIFVSFFGALLLVAAINHESEFGAFIFGDVAFFWVAAGGLAVLLVGVWDDVRGMRARWKFLFITLISVLMYTQDFAVETMSNPFGQGQIELGLWAIPLTLFWFVGCINAMNLIDGLDGLASGVGLFVATTVFVSSLVVGNDVLPYVSLALVGVLLGFLVFNFHPASIFLGDSGSLLLGFLIAAIGLLGAQKSRVAVALLIPIIALGLPVMDTLLAILRRWARATPLTSGDRQHIHHKLLDHGLSHRQAVLVLYGFCFVLGICALLLTALHSMSAAYVLALLAVLMFMVIHLFGRSEVVLAKRRVGEVVMRMRRGGATRAAVYEAVERMRQADTLDAVWAEFTILADALQLAHVDVVVDGSKTPALTWHNDRADEAAIPAHCVWRAELPLNDGERHVGEVRFKRVQRSGLLPAELPEAFAVLAVGLARNIVRFQDAAEAAENADA